MLEETRNDPENFCSACFTGDYPVPVPEPVKRSKLILEKVARSEKVPTA
jgi:amidophosphoribosyltransferase